MVAKATGHRCSLTAGKVGLNPWSGEQLMRSLARRERDQIRDLSKFNFNLKKKKKITALKDKFATLVYVSIRNFFVTRYNIMLKHK